MMGTPFVAIAEVDAITAVGAILLLEAESARVLVIDQVVVSSSGSTTAQQLRVQLRRAGNNGTGGGTNTPLAKAQETAAWSGVGLDAGTTFSAEPSAGDAMWVEGWHSIGPAIFHPTPEERPNGLRFMVELIDDVPTTIDVIVNVHFRVI